MNGAFILHKPVSLKTVLLYSYDGCSCDCLLFGIGVREVKLIGYITLGVSDVSKSGNFYDELFSIIGAKRVFEQTSCLAWAKDEGSVVFTILTPHNGHAPTAGNGTMIALATESELQVDSLHKKALEMGASDEELPGLRSGGYYCAYIKDFDGNKINFHFNPNAR